MAIAVEVVGPALVCVAQSGVNLPGTPVNTDGAGNLVHLGYTRNGVTLSYEDYFLDVPGDQHGGDDGPPIEVQWLGSIARIRCEFTKWDEDVFEAIAARVSTETFGDPGNFVVGHLMFSNESTTRVLVLPQPLVAGKVRNFPRCFIRAAIEINHASKYSSPIVEFEAHKDASGILHNKITSG